jgi:PAS domain S-box-containing protein
MLEALPVPVSWAEADGRIAFWNRRAEELFGYSSADVPSVADWYRLAYPDDAYRAEVVRGWEQAMSRAREGQREIHFGPVAVRTKQGHVVDVQIAGTLVGDQLLVIFHDVTDRLRAERALRESEAQLAAAFAAIPDAYAISSVASGHYILVNDGFTQITGWSREQALGKSSADLNLWVDYAQRNEVVSRLVETGVVADYEAKFRRQDGRVIDGVIFGRIIKVGETPLIITLTRDVTAERALERQLKEAERLESVGRLAGGVAHDFNILLTIIQGNLELALETLPAEHRVRGELEQTLEASNRAAAITRQLLAFGRVQLLSARAVDLNQALRKLEALLGRAIGENIELELELAEGLEPVMVDQTQLEQVVLNLVLNARDAMPVGGRLTIETSAIAEATVDGVRYARLSVTDTGQGMTKEVAQRIFEPFFTTKERGKGTGLGLASVYGIVRQSRGRIEVTSEPGKGASFRLDFPIGTGHPSTRPSLRVRPPVQARPRVVLVAEDEPSLGRLIERILVRAGHSVLLSSGAASAVRTADEYEGEIDLLLTDVIMPGESGVVLAERLAQRLPNLRVLFMSGFPGDTIAQHGLGAKAGFFISKPFTPANLVAKVAEVLAAPE